MIDPTAEMDRTFAEASSAARRAEIERRGLAGARLADMDAIAFRAGLAAVLAIVERDQLRGIPLDGEQVWTEGREKRLTLEMENSIGVEAADLGTADRPSEVVRLLRQAAADIEQAWRESQDSATTTTLPDSSGGLS